jgi:hypothetical protein
VGGSTIDVISRIRHRRPRGQQAIEQVRRQQYRGLNAWAALLAGCSH